LTAISPRSGARSTGSVSSPALASSTRRHSSKRSRRAVLGETRAKRRLRDRIVVRKVGPAGAEPRSDAVGENSAETRRPGIVGADAHADVGRLAARTRVGAPRPSPAANEEVDSVCRRKGRRGRSAVRVGPNGSLRARAAVQMVRPRASARAAMSRRSRPFSAASGASARIPLEHRESGACSAPRSPVAEHPPTRRRSVASPAASSFSSRIRGGVEIDGRRRVRAVIDVAKACRWGLAPGEACSAAARLRGSLRRRNGRGMSAARRARAAKRGRRSRGRTGPEGRGGGQGGFVGNGIRERARAGRWVVGQREFPQLAGERTRFAEGAPVRSGKFGISGVGSSGIGDRQSIAAPFTRGAFDERSTTYHCYQPATPTTDRRHERAPVLAHDPAQPTSVTSGASPTSWGARPNTARR